MRWLEGLHQQESSHGGVCVCVWAEQLIDMAVSLDSHADGTVSHNLREVALE